MASDKSRPEKMKALLQPDFEGPKTMYLVNDALVPTPGPGEVLLRVTAAGLNFADVMRAYGRYYGGPKPPFIAGFEATGEIVALGAGVEQVAVGQHVIGIGNGAFAEYMLMPAVGLAPIPAGWRDEQALGLVLNWATALAALKPLGRIAAKETVLIHAAAGGVGQAAVKMAKHYGATVIATASASKHAVVRALGADHVIDYHSGDLATKVREIVGKGGVDGRAAWAEPDAGLPKAYLLTRALDLRRRRPELFGPDGSYEALGDGPRRRFVAYCRGGGAVAVAPLRPVARARAPRRWG